MLQLKYVTDIAKIKRIPKITSQNGFFANDYYMNLIDWNDPDDPIRKLAIPNEGKLPEYGLWNSSDEDPNDAVPGCRHKYRTTALLNVSDKSSRNLDPAIDYISKHTEINNVILAGGDSLLLTASRLRGILQCLREFHHLKIIRLGSKIPVFNPMRIYEDPELLDTISEFSTPDKRIYVMAHISHPREITTEAKRAFQALHDAGAIVMSQTPILRGINDDPVVLGDLLDRLSWAGVAPYYFLVHRPSAGRHAFALPLKNIYQIVEEAKARTSGLGKRVRLSMNHSSGKIEILAVENGKVYLKYHHSRDGYYGKMMILDCSDDACWFDELPGSEIMGNTPSKETNDAVSVADLPYSPRNGFIISD